MQNYPDDRQLQDFSDTEKFWVRVTLYKLVYAISGLFMEDFERRCNKPDNTNVSKVSILRCLLRVFEETDTDIDLSGVRNEDDLLHRLLDALEEAHR